ncbi:glucose-methanol-choline oxidoreductase [Teratosphaeria nubilosa]|uniref:Glucose-methanol-choline oxidoreductase n=1 Tax=Teratosphaeria nubilosa TaxID=161662 RepID=A0A6G1L2U6_9PEZI|nr:glucose-methanol-choline oxidoreductase [Teratosphaeria nubilosa]
MTIKSDSVFDRPVINPDWLFEEGDQEVAVAAFKLARQAWQGVPRGVIAGPEMFPGANVTSDADLSEAVKGNIAPIHHATASCAMGKFGHPATVVDSEGRVIGVQGLRVVDSSSLPFTNPGHTQGSTYGHAERMVQVMLDSM